MDELKQLVDDDRFAKHLGIEILEHAHGRARARMALQDHHLNSAGMLHGGAIFALADAVLSAASNSHGTLAVAINVSMSYFQAMKSGTLTAVAEEVSLNSKLATYLIPVHDDKGNKIALFQGTVYRKKESLHARRTCAPGSSGASETRQSLQLLWRAEVLSACSHAATSRADVLSALHKFDEVGHARLHCAFFYHETQVLFVSRMGHRGLGHCFLLRRSSCWIQATEDAWRAA